jgi:hypothetical protein
LMKALEKPRFIEHDMCTATWVFCSAYRGIVPSSHPNQNPNKSNNAGVAMRAVFKPDTQCNS